jgi:hypothetical protein
VSTASATYSLPPSRKRRTRTALFGVSVPVTTSVNHKAQPLTTNGCSTLRGRLVSALDVITFWPCALDTRQHQSRSRGLRRGRKRARRNIVMEASVQCFSKVHTSQKKCFEQRSEGKRIISLFISLQSVSAPESPAHCDDDVSHYFTPPPEPRYQSAIYYNPVKMCSPKPPDQSLSFVHL